MTKRNMRIFKLQNNNGNIFFFFQTEDTQTVIKPRFYPRLCQFLMKKYTSH